ncbi:MAG TPA: hypothetical protein VMR52_05620 [Dehalococcoidia bacterium]|nr:hypothetical protein [Dehalococcoidia bacterium]
MGKKPAEIEQDIRDKRESISQKLDELTSRGSGDLQEVSERVQGVYRDSPLKAALDDHPLLAVAGAVGVGVALGMASDMFSSKESMRPEGGHRAYSADPSARVGGDFGGVIASLQGIVVEEARKFVDELMSPTKVNQDDRTPERSGREFSRESLSDRQTRR